MKIDNNVPHFICEGTPVTRLGDAQLRNSDFLELRNGCPLNLRNILSYLGQGWNYVNGGKQIIGYLRRNVLDEEISDDQD